MDPYTARKMSEAFIGRIINGWSIEKLLGHGKSAAVFLGRQAGTEAALKILDPEVVNRYGHGAQLKRIERELLLVGKSHPNLVRVFDGGEASETLFIAMEYFEGTNLAEVITKIPPTDIGRIISQVAAAAKFLEDSSYAHRDIKPENIGISPDLTQVKLLDLGVVRPFNLSNVTDEGDQKFFVGTLQYSPPELLFREEEQSVDAWRAITFYQLGAVLHDLIMRRPLFADFVNPYGRLVRAVEREVPRIEAPGADAGLRLLAQNCLAKAPRHRLDTVKWENFSQPDVTDPLDSARRRIAQRRVAAEQARHAESNSRSQLESLSFSLRTSIHSSVVSTITAESLPRYSTQRILETNPFLLRVLFEPSAVHGLTNHFALYCTGTVLDAAASLQELRISACISAIRETVPAEPEPKAPANSISGALIDQDVRAQIEKCLLLAYAEALEGAAPPAGHVMWLNMGENR